MDPKSEEKDIRFTEKKVDDGWKEHAVRDKNATAQTKIPPANENPSKGRPEPKTSKAFTHLISSLGFQAMMSLGEIPNPETNQTAVNLEAAREIIDLLVGLKEKTENNTSPEETRLLMGLLSELQLKYSQKV